MVWTSDNTRGVRFNTRVFEVLIPHLHELICESLLAIDTLNLSLKATMVIQISVTNGYVQPTYHMMHSTKMTPS